MRDAVATCCLVVLVSISGLAADEGLALPLRDRKEVVQEAKAVAPELLEVRLKLDGIYEEYCGQRMTLGTRAQKAASRRASTLVRNLTAGNAQLGKLYERARAPYERTKKALLGEQGKLLDRINKLEERGRDTSRDDKKVATIDGKLADVEKVLELLTEVGVPDFTLEGTEHMLIRSLVKPTLQLEPTFDAILRKHPELVEARLTVAHLSADLGQAGSKPSEKGSPAVDPARVQRALDAATEDLQERLADTRKDYEEELEEIKEEDAKLTAKAGRYAGKSSAAKYREPLERLAARSERLQDILKALALFEGKAEKGEEQVKKADAAEKD